MSVAGAVAAEYGGGAGTQADPYQIGSAADWATLSITTEDWDKHFVLTANIDFAGVSLTPIGTSATPFNGAFDGNDYVLRNGQITIPEMNEAGVFGHVGRTVRFRISAWNQYRLRVVLLSGDWPG